MNKINLIQFVGLSMKEAEHACREQGLRWGYTSVDGKYAINTMEVKHVKFVAEHGKITAAKLA